MIPVDSIKENSFFVPTYDELPFQTIYYGVAPVAAPMAGGVMAGSIHFRESLPAARCQHSGWRDVYDGFVAVTRNRRYVCYIFQFGFAQAVLFANIYSAPFIMQEHYGLSPLAFSIYFGINALAIVISAASSARFFHPEQALYRGSIGMVVASLFLCVALCSECSFWVYEILLVGLLSMLGLTFTSSNTLAMDCERSHAGMASALLGALDLLSEESSLRS